ncbi:uncharacterized protein [Amphiura filiformis]|uniref:uncharacterized protein n=1 Tax=Amphiura filiformis TaxID=82378 RepID=UPI003B21C55A
MSDEISSENVLLILDLLKHENTFPLLVEVHQDLRADTKPLKSGSLLWLLRYGQDEATDKQAVRVVLSDAPSMEFPLPLDDAITVYHREYHEVANRLGDILGPSMDVSFLASIASFEYPVFVVCNEEQEKRGERLLIHGKEKMQGYLVKGEDCMLVIPDDYRGTFKEYSSPSDIKLPIFGSLFDIITKKWFDEVKVTKCDFVYDPLVDMIYENDIIQLIDTTIRVAENGDIQSDIIRFERLSSERGGKLGIIRVSTKSNAEFEACEPSEEVFTPENLIVLNHISSDQFPIVLTYEKFSSDSYMSSLNDDILRNGSPLTIFGKCSYTVTYISLHTSDPFGVPSLAIEMIPDYYPMEVRPAYPIPIQLQEIKSKPQPTIHAITSKQFQHLLKTIKSNKPMSRGRPATHPVPAPRDNSKSRSQTQSLRQFQSQSEDGHSHRSVATPFR